jgi:hypothetical protein
MGGLHADLRGLEHKQPHCLAKWQPGCLPRDPWLSVPASQQVWRLTIKKNDIPACLMIMASCRIHSIIRESIKSSISRRFHRFSNGFNRGHDTICHGFCRILS